MAEYKLSASLAGHEDDVRGVAYPSSKAVVSGSRDGTVRLWKLLSDNPPIFDEAISSHATAFVNAVASLPPSPDFKDGLILSGGKDTIIEVREPFKKPEDNAERLLIGHAGNICALDVDSAGEYIISGSWDATARTWPVGKWEPETEFRGHEGSVWGVLAYDKDTVITACADQLIRIFSRSGKLIRKLKGGNEVVRTLCRVTNHPTGADFASAGNDGIVRLWSIKGEQLAELHGHDNFIYSLVSTPSGELVSSSEDRTVRIWKGIECIQTITHPAISVWSVAVCQENGDLVTGASDRVVRIFTRDPERFADVETTEKFVDSVKESSIPQQQLGEINKEKLPGPEFIQQKSGTKDGQVQMIRELNGNVSAYMWAASSGKWDNVGTVVDAAGSSGKKVEFDGQEYDYVFDVDVEDGKPPLKLPFNASQNPYEAAQKFLDRTKLPQTYLEQIAAHIVANAQGVSLDQPMADAPSGPGSDPWGSDQRYRPDTAQAPTPAALPKYLPQKDYLSISVASLPKLQQKVQEVNKTLVESGQKDISLNPEELSTLSAVRRQFEEKSKTPAPGGLELAIKLATVWPYKDRMAGLDLLRLLADSKTAATYRDTRGGNVIDLLIQGATETEPHSENHLAMAVRGFANLFSTPEGRELTVSSFDKIQSLTSTSISTSTNRNLLVAATTVYVNYAVLLLTSPSDSTFEQALAVVDTLRRILTTQKDSEVIFRALVAVGTIVGVDAEVKSAAKDIYEAEKAMETALGKASEPRIKQLVAEIKGILKT
ncbi:WD40-repeat-containing domain protein [Calycina marina]|uniref:WD40-repeat-containing domain protein n=1 Tax=Calycina marina TaxID=1763456 RepID=A0A9P7YXS5_9HELO|nr:WD40-repeat-containing domain protein [Calycina marina]